MRPTYALLLRHAWLAALMKPPTISEDGEAEAAAEAGADTSSFRGAVPGSETADIEVANWVRAAIERKLSGKSGKPEKPALHAAPLDAVPGSPLLDRQGLKRNTSSTASPDQCQNKNNIDQEGEIAAAADSKPRNGVTVESPALRMQEVHSMDFASRVSQSDVASDSERRTGDEVQRPKVRTDAAAEEDKDG